MIKVTLGEKPKEKPFPKLMKLITDGYLYYFVSAGIGVPLNDPQYPGALERSDLFNWDMDLFKDYSESVTIQNA